jgi:hypothetical protein
VTLVLAVGILARNLGEGVVWAALIGLTTTTALSLVRRTGAARAELVSILGGIAVEELMVVPFVSLPAALGATGPTAPQLPIYLAAYLAGVAVLVLVMADPKLPEWLFPLRGAWLRRLLAVVGLAAVFSAGPWWALISTDQNSVGLPSMLRLILATNYVFYFCAAVRALSPLSAPRTR